MNKPPDRVKESAYQARALIQKAMLSFSRQAGAMPDDVYNDLLAACRLLESPLDEPADHPPDHPNGHAWFCDCGAAECEGSWEPQLHRRNQGHECARLDGAWWGPAEQRMGSYRGG